MDIFGPTRTQSLEGKMYCLVIVDDYTKNTWIFFLTHKHEAFSHFSIFAKRVQNEKGYTISCIKIRHGSEFENQFFFLIFVMKMVLSINFQLPTLLNKTML